LLVWVTSSLKYLLCSFEKKKVKSIVDKAVKESAMEKVLRELDTTWSTMKFENEPHTRTKIPLLLASDELIETLEDNQVKFTP
jgi:dynein heavy chain